MSDGSFEFNEQPGEPEYKYNTRFLVADIQSTRRTKAMIAMAVVMAIAGLVLMFLLSTSKDESDKEAKATVASEVLKDPASDATQSAK